MKIFVTVLLATLAYATADISLPPGYNYQPQQSYHQQPQQHQQQQQQQQQHQPLLMQLINTPLQQQIRSVVPQISLPNQQYLPSNSVPQATQAVSSLPMPSNFPAPGSFQAPIVAKPARRSRPRVKIAKKPIVTKNFFIHAAPEESEDEIQEELAQLAQQPRKHYNVLFVKTPSQTSRAAAVNLAKALKEEKTVVYVLSKKTSATDLQDAISDAPQHINKPEVFFIKYRTPEEAAHAQHQIQSQYDSLGGTSIITDEGVAPVTSVVGSLDAPEEEEEVEEAQLSQPQQPQGGQQFDDQLVNNINNIDNQYLPPGNQF